MAREKKYLQVLVEQLHQLLVIVISDDALVNERDDTGSRFVLKYLLVPRAKKIQSAKNKGEKKINIKNWR